MLITYSLRNLYRSIDNITDGIASSRPPDSGASCTSHVRSRLCSRIKCLGDASSLCQVPRLRRLDWLRLSSPDQLTYLIWRYGHAVDTDTERF